MILGTKGILNAIEKRNERLRRRARRSLLDFTIWEWTTLNPSPDQAIEVGWHNAATAAHVDAWLAGEWPGQWVVINIPPAESKSTITSRNGPPFHWLRDPTARFLCGTHNAKLGRDLNVDRRTILTSRRYQLLRPGFTESEDRLIPAVDWEPDPADWGKLYFKNSAQGYCSITSPRQDFPLGIHPTHHLWDDPVRPAANQLEPAEWLPAFVFMDQTLAARFGNRSKGNKLVVMQRLGEGDPSGLLLKKYRDRIVHLNIKRRCVVAFPCLCRPPGTDTCTTSLGFKDPRKVDGEMLPGTRITAQELDDMDPIEYATQQQQTGTSHAGDIFPIEAWQFWTSVPKRSTVATLLDASNGNKDEGASDCAFIAIAEDDGRIYVLDEIVERFNAMEIARATLLWCRRWDRGDYHLIELKALGRAAVDRLRHMGFSGVEGIVPDKYGSKPARAGSWAQYQRKKQYFLPSQGSYRPPMLPAQVDPDPLLHMPYVSKMHPVIDAIREGDFRLAFVELVRIDPDRLDEETRAIYDLAVEVVISSWGPWSKARIDRWRRVFAALPGGNAWDRADAMFLGSLKFAKALGERYSAGGEDGTPEPPKPTPTPPRRELFKSARKGR